MPKFMKKTAYFFIYPMLIIAAFDMFRYVYINISSVVLAFTETNGGTHEVSFSLRWFEEMFRQFSLAQSSLKDAIGNTVKFFLMYFAKTLISFVVAYFLFKKIWGYKVFRIIFYIPCMISPIILVNVWKNMLMSGGLYSQIVNAFGGSYSNPLTNGDTALSVILLFSFWGGFGTDLLIFVGAMNRVPEEILDAGLIDGCGISREFFSLIIPLVWETLSTMLMIQSMSIFTATGPILYFSPNEPKTYTLQFFLFNKVTGFGGDGAGGTANEFNQVAAIGLFFTLIALPIVLFGRWLMNKFNSDISY
ncbi:MAG: sugar ABC transporter permease [Clostridiales bacterium]|nr:sugar ABC transporter permease [Clostridiales bacterium]